ncbi:hypothetical protein B0O41_3958 [Propionibacteriaceae bacterium ES.041]|nr:hypothetical protein B0O41_3958 [Propionibacteriaceae bacterium ES.041]
MTTYTTKKAEVLAERLAAQQAENERLLAAIQAEQEAHQQRLADALEKAGPARVALVEDLLEQFGIGPAEHAQQRNKRTGEVIRDKRTGRPKTVDPDPGETARMERLADAIADLRERASSAAAQPPAGPEQLAS